MRRRRALITGISGQDGTYLAESLHRDGVEVWGVSRREPSPRLSGVATVLSLDVQDTGALDALIRDTLPDECYHLSAYHRSSQTPISESKLQDEDAVYLRTNLVATSGLLSSIRRHQRSCRVFLAGSCHMFGEAQNMPQNEQTPFVPNSLYGITKVASTQLGHVYRQRDDIFCATGILYNHESPLRDQGFITTRLARGAAEIRAGRGNEIVVGNLDAEVDWGFAGDYVEAMRMMLAAPKAADYVIASGSLHRIRDFAQIAFARVGLDWSKHVRQDSNAHRPVSRAVYCGNPSRIENELGWKRNVAFPDMVTMMVDHHVAMAS